MWDNKTVRDNTGLFYNRREENRTVEITLYGVHHLHFCMLKNILRYNVSPTAGVNVILLYYKPVFLHEDADKLFGNKTDLSFL